MMVKKPWGGRFKTKTDPLMREFSQSVSFDRRLLEADLAGSRAHARMLGKCGIITKKEAGQIVRALEEIQAEAKKGKIKFRPELEDVHMNVEQMLRKKIGDLAGKLHTARSRNDQVALDMRLYFRERAGASMDLIVGLCRALLKAAEDHKDAVMPGFTHTRKAQPVLFAHHLLAYVEMFLRDKARFSGCLERINICPLGSGALAGTTFPIDRKMVAEELGFHGVSANSIDAVSDRDYLIEFASCASITMTHLSRLMEEIIWWGLPELGFVELPEPFCTGSSMMPNKKNPDAAELVRGKTGRVIGSLVSLLTVVKATPLSYNRDFQEDKEGMFDAADTLEACLKISRRLIEGMEVDEEKMLASARTGFILATDLADYLAAKGMPFRQAHEVVGKIVRFCEKEGKTLEELDLKKLRSFSELFQSDVKKWVSIEGALKRRDVLGGTAPRQVSRQIRRLKNLLE